MERTRRQLLALSALGLAGACVGPRPRPHTLEPLEPEPEPEREPAASAPRSTGGQEIVVCGQRHAIDTPVVLWSAAGGYDATSTQLAFPGDPPAQAPTGLRYAPGRRRSDGRSARPDADLAELAEVVDQFVLHYDACATSRRCFQVLHDRRGLSVHFLLDLDGTLYQTLDLVHTAWHARQANARSVGVEIAQIGAYAPGERHKLDAWYRRDAQGARVVLPADRGDGGVRTPGFIARPRRAEPVRGRIQGRELVMYDYTLAQYRALARLTFGLARVFPGLELQVPRYASGARRGQVRAEVLSDPEFASYRGILGHQHVSVDKVDPGPAFDWDFLLRSVAAVAPSPG